MADDFFNSLLDKIQTRGQQAAVPSKGQPAPSGVSDQSVVTPEAPFQKSAPAAVAEAPTQAPAPEAPIDNSQPAPTPSPQPGPSPTPPADIDPFQRALQQKMQESNDADNGDQLGSLKNPLPSSPIGAIEHFNMGLGNNPGKIDLLKKQFQDVALTPDKGLLVKQNNQWMQAEPGFTDPWKLTAAIAKQFVKNPSIQAASDVGASAMNSLNENAKEASQAVGKYGAVTAIAGAAGVEGAEAAAPLGIPFGPAGPLVAGTIGGLSAAFGGGLASGAFRTSLGRYLGTFQSDAAEQIKDIGLEGLMGLGNQIVAVGAKPAFEQVVNALGYMKTKATDASKTVISEILGRASGAGPENIQNIIEAPGAYNEAFRSVASDAANAADMKNNAGNQQISKLTTLLESSSEALPEKYGELLRNLKNAAGRKTLTVTPGNIFQTAADSMDSSGFGRIDINPKGSFELIPFSEVEKASRLQQGLPIEDLTDDALSSINKIVKQLTNYAKVPTVKGDAAVNVLTGINRSVGNILKDLYKTDAPPATLRAVSQIKSGISNGIGADFNNAGLGAEYSQMQNLYKQYADPVDLARSAVRNGNVEGLVSKLSSAAGKNLTAKGDVSKLVELAGDQGAALYKDIVMLNAVKNTASWAPKVGLVQAGAIGGAIGKIGPSAIVGNPLISIPVAAQLSPRIVGNEAMAIGAAGHAINTVGKGTAAWLNPVVQYGLASKDFINSLSSPLLNQLLQNPHALHGVLSTPGIAPEQEDQMKQQLLKQFGVIR